jgi:hypothetical protein
MWEQAEQAAYPGSPGCPSLYNLCQELYEREWDLNESTADWSCICGFKYHVLTYAGTPLLYKKGDEMKILLSSGEKVDTYRLERIGLMPRGWSANPGQDKTRNMLLSKVVEALSGFEPHSSSTAIVDDV